MDLFRIAAQFTPNGQVLTVQEYGFGNVNDTYLVTVDTEPQFHFVLQRINTHVFPRPELIAENMHTFMEHIARRLGHEQVDSGRRWEMPHMLPANDGKHYLVDPQDGSFWRALSFVGGSRSYETVQDIGHAREAGYALGRFQSLISDLEIGKLHDTLEGFHVTPRYLQHYDRVLTRNGYDSPSPEVKHCFQFIDDRRGWAAVLEDAKDRNQLPLRPIHGDPKVNNIMIDEATGQAISIVDLDTVKPGLVHYDIGDCLRSCCNSLGEETERTEDVHFEIDLCRAILEGYLAEARGFLSQHDYAYLYDAIRLIPFELGLRFFTDYLEGDVYFKAKHREHNLQRALVQFKLAESIEAQEMQLRALIAGLT